MSRGMQRTGWNWGMTRTQNEQDWWNASNRGGQGNPESKSRPVEPLRKIVILSGKDFGKKLLICASIII